MSSTVDQRSSKPVGSQGAPQQQQQQANDGEYTYPPTQAVAMQSGYHPGAGLGGPADAAAYQMYGGAGVGAGAGGYDPTYMAFTSGMMADPSNAWSTDPSMAYGGYGPADYLPYADGSGGNSVAGGQYGMMAGPYDYSAVGWYPAGLDYAATWGQSGILPMQQQAKSRFIDYSSGYYDGMTMDNSIIARAGGNVAQQQSSNMGSGANRYPSGDVNGYHNMDQSFKNMQLSPTANTPAENGSERGVSYHEQLTGSAGGGDGGQYDHNDETPVSGNSANSGASEANSGNSQQKKSWANVASLPAAKTTILPRPKQSSLPRGVLAVSAGVRQEAMMNSRSNFSNQSASSKHQESNSSIAAPVLGQYNPKEFDVSAKFARFFVIKSFSEDDIHRSIKFSIWCSTEYGNKRLDAAYRERDGKGPVYLLFSVNGSGHFCGVAVMTSAVDYQNSSNVWAQDKWKGTFSVQWIFVKDVPNSQLRHIRLENNEGRPVTNSRDTQEVPIEKGRQVLRIIHQYRHTTSIFDDFQHYEKQLTENGDNNNDSSASAGNNNNVSSAASSGPSGVNGNSRQPAASNKATNPK